MLKCRLLTRDSVNSACYRTATVREQLIPGLLGQDLFGDGQLLYVGGAFVNPADFGVAIELLYRIILGETHPAENLHRTRSRVLSHLRREVLGHGSLGDVRMSCIAQPRRVIH